MKKLLETPDIPISQNVLLEPSKTAVIVVDMQNDFVRKEGKLYVPQAESTLAPIKRILKRARDAGAHVIYTQDWHMKDDPEFKIWGEHAVAGSWGAEIVEELIPEKDDYIVKKLRYDAFFGTSLDYYLNVKEIKNLVVVGTVANICVLHTTGSAALRWYNVIMPLDGISAITEFDFYSTLRQVDFLYKGKITASDGITFK
ncbi:cysteine hydrolase family protein [Metallosphaera hakonensis]|uniref:Isochorismatase n=1 Tax=Metallosphaera hakonensis JCM 8857 = DSM 7519 TaxID=1293036 RepID=A0A2U9IVQ2_9CREN|nr:isochorismatase family cysteine hydrolase [Metallosphaera hakonensis]AWS00140.1 isochorismatase family protein [Metallosphaera hakonensis JCM 8857 = DSM 7519]